MISIGKLLPSDRADWEALFRGYNDFCGRTLPNEVYDRAWAVFREDTRMHALAARFDGELVGIHRVARTIRLAMPTASSGSLREKPEASWGNLLRIFGSVDACLRLL